MTATLPDRLLADDELLNRLFAESNNFALREDVRALIAEAHNAIVEAAALSAPEGDMARALEWVREVAKYPGNRPTEILSDIEEAIAAYDPERAGARSGKATTPQPGDGWRPIAEAPFETDVLVMDAYGFMQVAMWVDSGKWLDRNSHNVRATHWMPLPAAPSANGVANG